MPLCGYACPAGRRTSPVRYRHPLLPLRRDGRRVRILVVVDDRTRACAVRWSIPRCRARGSRGLDLVIAGRGEPLRIVPGNGTERVSHAILRRQEERAVERRDSAPVRRSRTASSRASTPACITSESLSRALRQQGSPPKISSIPESCSSEVARLCGAVQGAPAACSIWFCYK